jgi:hypothetical protein
VVVAIAKQMSSFFDYLETGGNKASTFVIDSQQSSTEFNRIKQNQTKRRGIEGG